MAWQDEMFGKFQLGDYVRKRRGSRWRGRVVGFYSTARTPVGVCVESHFEPGSVQIYPEDALEGWQPFPLTMERE